MKKFMKVFFLGVIPALTLYISVHQNFFLSSHWLFGFIYLLTPLLLFINCTTCLYLLLKKTYISAILIIITLLLSYNQITETFGFNLYKDKAGNNYEFTVTSYNAATFNYYRWNNILDTVVSKNNLQWISENISSDILCIQEFYNNDAVIAESALKKIRESGYPFYYTNPIKLKNHNGFFGLLTFSKYPIVNGGPIIFTGKKSLNRGVYTDIKIKTDTIRIVNTHLESMSIRIDPNISIFDVKSLYESKVNILSKLKKGFQNRRNQIKIIEDFTQNSPYPVIICGDLNDTPYSYSYKRLKKFYRNAFEDAGKGFGFTYNKFPWFIRIDHQFFTNHLKAVDFKVYRNNKYSDHYPIETKYVIKRESP